MGRAFGAPADRLTVINQAAGVIEANSTPNAGDDPNASRLDIVSVDLTNQGAVKATQSGGMFIDNSTINNAGGRVTAEGALASYLIIHSSSVDGGTLGAEGGTLVAMGNACDLAIERLPIPVRNLKKGLTRDQHFAPGAILKLEVDVQHPLGYGVASDTYGFYINSPFFSIVEGFASQKTSVVARYPNTNVIASGWLKGEELMAGRAAVVSIDMNPGRVVLFGLRPQHRAQTHATFPMIFDAMYWQ